MVRITLNIEDSNVVTKTDIAFALQTIAANIESRNTSIHESCTFEVEEKCINLYGVGNVFYSVERGV
jgi:hypothetical protein